MSEASDARTEGMQKEGTQIVMVVMIYYVFFNSIFTNHPACAGSAKSTLLLPLAFASEVSDLAVKFFKIKASHGLPLPK